MPEKMGTRERGSLRPDLRGERLVPAVFPGSDTAWACFRGNPEASTTRDESRLSMAKFSWRLWLRQKGNSLVAFLPRSALRAFLKRFIARPELAEAAGFH